MSGYGEGPEMRPPTGFIVWDPKLVTDIKQALVDHRTMMEVFYLLWMASLGWLLGGALA